MKNKDLNELENKLKRAQQKLKKFDGKHEVEFPYTEEQWNNMTEIERKNANEEQEQNLIDKLVKDLFN